MTEHLSKTGFEVLAKARELYTQKELGDLIRRSSKQISRWEKSQAVPPELVPALERAIRLIPPWACNLERNSTGTQH